MGRICFPSFYFKLLVSILLLFCSLSAVSAFSKDDRLIASDGSWHRDQRAFMTFEATCALDAQPALGCVEYADPRQAFAATNGEAKELEKAALMELFRVCNGAGGRCHGKK
eukprot:GDKI01042076.1.p1 GENE.GDKI01042076.1~~GDKI01042076.1.p1  ORF type:complete len:111 (-),score=11.21 GDKI01042076.1:1-333(-)